MELSQRIEGSHAIASPSGQLIAFVADSKLRICGSQHPEHQTATKARLPPAKEGLQLRWSQDGRIAVVSQNAIEVVVIADGWRGNISNGGRGFGRFATAEFVGSEHLLTTWEFGRANAWTLDNGKTIELGDVKTTCTGPASAQRPTRSGSANLLALLSRSGAEDHLTMYLPDTGKAMPIVRVPSVDAQSISWSPDGRWLAVLDTPTASTGVYFYTPNGHLYRSHTHTAAQDTAGLGFKAVAWSRDSRTVALSGYDGKIVLLNTRTFSPLAMIEHSTMIHQHSLPVEQQAPIWQESVSASGGRSYGLASQPVSPPLSRTKPSSEPAELGVAEACFSCDGNYLATRDERMLNTVWIWSMATLSAHAVVMQHSNVRKMQWHPTRAESLMLDCGEGIAYLFDAASASPPSPLPTSIPGTPALTWLHTESDAKLAILAATKSAFRILYPEGRPVPNDSFEEPVQLGGGEQFEEGTSQDSLMDVLSGRKPLPPKMEQSYTEMVDLEADAADNCDVTIGLDDTFREKRKPVAREVEVDPLDDSEIF